MIRFEDSYFVKFSFTAKQLTDYLASAQKDLSIAHGSQVPEVVFQFSYNALIKLGIVLVAKQGYKVHGKTGHHAKIIEKLAELLGDEEVGAVGNLMRKTRNIELYSGGSVITEKQAREYLEFCSKAAKTARSRLQ
ncbi:MAG: hypothetical protein WC621_02505 [Patescibacteria group bacterium]